MSRGITGERARFGKIRARGLLLLASATLWLACASPGPAAPGRTGPSAAAERPSGPQRITAVIRGDPHTVYQKLNPRSNIPGIDDLEHLVNSGLTVVDDHGNRQPRLAEAVPTVENGLWNVLPDGRMETTWTIREGARWQDGEALTAEDLVFTAQVCMDPDLPILGHLAYDSVDRAEMVDPRTVLVRWKTPYIMADAMFTKEFALALPKHLLEKAYLQDREHFTDLPYFSTDFVGTGPFKIKDWERGSHLVFEANDIYLLGRPKLDEFVVKFIPDPNTVGANFLAGEIDLTLGGRFSTEWAMAVRDQWKDGRMVVSTHGALQIYPQFIDPTPAIVGSNVEFRRAMLRALDRQQMMEVLQFGLTGVAHTFVAPTEPEYPFVDSAIVKYDYDPQGATRTIAALGYTKGSDGVFRDAAGEKLHVQVRTSQGDDLQEKSLYASADDWQRLGVDVERHLVPPQRARDAEYRATFPSFDVKRQAGTMDYAKSFHSSRVALPENDFLVSGNNARYMNPDLDRAIDQYFTTISMQPRMEAARQVVHQVSDQVVWMGLFYQTDPDLIANRLTGLTHPESSDAYILWNVHEWSVQ